MSTPLKRACLMGHPVAHSRSPMIHGFWLRTLGIAGAYELQDILPEAYPAFLKDLRGRGYVGGNVTVPHKEVAFGGVDRRDPAAEAIGAVNTIWYEGDRMMGGNSDAHGFITNLDALAPDWQVQSARATVLGAGGSARAAVYALQARGVEVALVNRTLERAETLARHFGAGVRAYAVEELRGLMPQSDVLINCTSQGMDGKPPLEIDLCALKRSAVVYDIVYVPLETGLLSAARARGHRTVDGLGMLLHQAGFGFQKWFGVVPQVSAALRAPIEADIRAKTASK